MNTAGSDAKIYHALGGKNSYVIPGYGNEFAGTSQGLKVFIDTGWLICFGRNIQNDAIEELTIPANTTGYITVTLDMTKENIPHGNWWESDYYVEQNQVKFEVRSDLIWSSPSNDDQVFTFPLYSYKSTDTTTTLTKYNESFDSAPFRTKILFDSKREQGAYWTAADSFNLGPLSEMEWLLTTWSQKIDAIGERYITQFHQFHRTQFMGRMAQHIPLIAYQQNGQPQMCTKILHWDYSGDDIIIKGDNYNSENTFSRNMRLNKLILLKGRWHET